MTGTDLYVNKRTAQQLCDLERVKPQPPPSLLLGLELFSPVWELLSDERTEGTAEGGTKHCDQIPRWRKRPVR